MNRSIRAVLVPYAFVLFLAAPIRGGEPRVGALDRVVESPVETVEVEVYESAVRTDPAHRDLGISDPLVPCVTSSIGLLGGPRMGMARTQDETIELRHSGFTVQRGMTKDRLIELSRTVLALEP